MRASILLASIGLLVALGACATEDATTAVVDNAYPRDPTGSIVVYRVWWQTTLFPDPVGAGESSAELRAVPSTDVAYALLAPGYEPTSDTPPAKLVLAMTKVPLSVNRGRTLHIVVSDDLFVGNCAASGRLTQQEADFIASRIFPGDLAGRAYDPTTCTLSGEADGGTDSAVDAGAD